MNLPDNTFLQGGKYRIIRFISSGGFGCTYEAELVLLHKRVAIKEFFVKDFCNRDENTSHVTVATQSGENGAYPPTQNGLIHPQLLLKWP